MEKELFILLILGILFSGCVEQESTNVDNIDTQARVLSPSQTPEQTAAQILITKQSPYLIGIASNPPSTIYFNNSKRYQAHNDVLNDLDYDVLVMVLPSIDEAQKQFEIKKDSNQNTINTLSPTERSWEHSYYKDISSAQYNIGDEGYKFKWTKSMYHTGAGYEINTYYGISLIRKANVLIEYKITTEGGLVDDGLNRGSNNMVAQINVNEIQPEPNLIDKETPELSNQEVPLKTYLNEYCKCNQKTMLNGEDFQFDNYTLHLNHAEKDTASITLSKNNVVVDTTSLARGEKYNYNNNDFNLKLNYTFQRSTNFEWTATFANITYKDI